MKILLTALLSLNFLSAYAADPCANVALNAAKALDQVNSKQSGDKSTLGKAIKTKMSLPAKGATQAYKVDVKLKGGAEFYYLVQTREIDENCFVETVSYEYDD